MKRFLAATTAALAACGGGHQPPPQTEPGAAGNPAAAPAPTAPLRYRFRDPLQYEIIRYDTLVYRSMPGAPEASARRAVFSVRQAPGRPASEILLVLDSIAGISGSRIGSGTVDSAIGTRWSANLLPTGPRGSLSGPRGGTTTGQMEGAIRLLLPQLPTSGLRIGDTWADSAIYRSKMDAFEATESSVRSSRAEASDSAGLVVTAMEQLTRSGTTTQGGQTMALRGSGQRTIHYVFAPEGWVRSLSARDSLELVVTVTPAGQSIPVMWRSTILAQVRAPTPH